MLHPSYADLMNVVNNRGENGEIENGDEPIINSRYSIVIAASKRARQLIEERGEEESGNCFKPLSIAVEELDNGSVKILGEDDIAEEDIELTDDIVEDVQAQEQEEQHQEADAAESEGTPKEDVADEEMGAAEEE